MGEGEKFTKASVEENVMCGEDALHLWDVVMFYTPIRRDLFSASDIEECFRTSLGVVMYSDMGRHNSCHQEGLVLACRGVRAVRGGRY